MNQETILVEPIVSDDSIFYNSDGKLRLCLVRNHYGLLKDVTGCKYIERNGVQILVPIFKKRIEHELTVSEIGDIADTYVEWRNQPEYLPLRLTYENTTDGTSKKEWNYQKISKRGNDVYVKNIKEVFAPFIDPKNKLFQKIVWFDPDIFVSKKTNLLYITLEYNPSCHTLCESYYNVGIHFNSFITNLRKKFSGCNICPKFKSCVIRKKRKQKFCMTYNKLKNSKIVFLRGWHAHDSGYPHVHILVYFRDYEFQTVLYNDVWRLTRAKQYSGAKQTIKQKIEDCWEHGYVDIRCVSDTQKAFKDIVKYTTNDFGKGKEERLAKGKCDLTLSLLWYFGKQSYGLSEDFFDVVFGSGYSIDEVDTNEITPITSNSNLVLTQIEVLPLVPPEFLKISSAIIELIGADPPPEIRLELENLIDSCTSRVITRDDGVNVIVYSRRYF